MASAHAENNRNLPKSGQVISGGGSLHQSANNLLVNQSSDKLILDWQSFSIAPGHQVEFKQPSSTSAALNKVSGGSPSEIFGALKANGRVFLVNPSGVLFSPSAQVNVGGLIASTLDISQDDFLNGDYAFEGSALTAVENHGAITAESGGFAAFIGAKIENSGTITANDGSVLMGAGSRVKVNVDGALYSLDIQSGVVEGLINQDGIIQADNGRVWLSAGAAAELKSNTINHSGISKANSLQVGPKGEIILSSTGHVSLSGGSKLSAAGLNAGQINIQADTAMLGGVIDASSTGSGVAGGKIELDIDDRLSLSGQLQATSGSGRGGFIGVKAGQIVQSTSSELRGDGATGGFIHVDAGMGLLSSGAYSSHGQVGPGGMIDITGSDLRFFSATLNAAGQSMGGMVRLGGAFQGGKPVDPSTDYFDSFIGRWSTLSTLSPSQKTFINDTTKIDVQAHAGVGGTAIIWSDDETSFFGQIDASGNTGGGSVEISSANELRKASLIDVSVGEGGHILLDPKNITIGDSATVQSWSYAGIMGFDFAGTQKNQDVSALENSDMMSFDVSLNAAGDRLAVGAAFDDGANNSAYTSGAVYLFSFTDGDFSGGALQATIGKGYTGGKNVDVSALEGYDWFGITTALNAAGDRLAVGAVFDDGSGNASTYSGAVYLFSFSDTDFSSGTLQATVGKGYTGGKNVDVSALGVDDRFGRAVALNAAGDRLAVGAVSDDGAGNSVTDSGAAYLFSFTDGDFSGGALQATIGKGYAGGKNVDFSVLEAGDRIGRSVSLNAAGDRLVVSTHIDDGSGNNSTYSGAAYLFSFADTNFSGGTLQASVGKGYTGGKNIDVSALDAGDRFGQSVSLNAAGDRLAVGALQDDGSGNAAYNTGAVYLFSFNDTDFSGGALVATMGEGYTGGKNVNVSSLDADDRFGRSVALNAAGDRLAVGVVNDGANNSTPDSGSIYLFSFTDGDFSNGTLQAIVGKGYTGGKNVDVSRLDTGDWFGISVALNAVGDRLAVGANFEDGANNSTINSGAVYLFSFADRNFSGGTLQAIMGKGYSGGKNVDVSTLESGDKFGVSIALNAAGNRLAVGASTGGGAGNTSTYSGAVYLFSFSDTDFSGGTLQATVGKGYTGGKNVDVSALDADERFGRAVALNAAADRLAVGAPFDDGAGNSLTNSGAVYLFSFTDGDFSGGALEATMGKGYTGGKNVDFSPLGVHDWFGIAVALNPVGDRLAVGTIWDDGAGNTSTDTGAVYLFSFTDSNFSGGTLQATIGKGYTGGKNVNVSSLGVYDAFGISVALNAGGDRLAVGHLRDDGQGNTATDAGAVYLFSFTDSNFSGGTLQATIGKGYTGGKNVNVSSLESGDEFGVSIALNAAGDRLAVGAQKGDGAGNSLIDSGAVYLFSFSDTDFSGGTLQATMGKGYTGGKNVDVNALDGNDRFGQSIALSEENDLLAVGTIRDRGAGNTSVYTGAVYLFSFADSNFSGGMLQATIGQGYSGGKNVNVSGLDAFDYFGTSVALNASGDRLVVGSQDDGVDNTSGGAGAAFLFSFTDGAFSGGTLEATIGKGYTGGKNVDVTPLTDYDYFARSVSLNAAGDRLAVGAVEDYGANDDTYSPGAVYLFSFTDTDFSGGALVATLGKDYSGGKNVDVSALEQYNYFGQSVALNAVGNRLAVGANGDDGNDNNAASSGAVYLFSFTDTDFSGGALVATLGKGYSGGKNLDVSALESYDRFGQSVALNAVGNQLAVGAIGDDGNDNNAASSGAVYLFSFNDGDFSGGALEATFGKGYSGGKNVDVSALESSDSFGQSVALNAAGDRLAVGAYGDDGNNNSASMSGAVYLFTSGTETGSYPVESGAAFAAHGDQSISVSAADLRSKLSLGQNITLQASNDITLSSDINVVGSAANGGDLTLRAGRSILLNASLVTNDGNLTLFANDTLANGVVDRHRDTGNAEISMAAGTSIDAGSGAVSITLLDGAGKTNSGSGNISLRNITAGTITAVNSGPTTGSGITLSSGALAASGSGDAIVLSGQSFTNTAGASALSAGSGRWLVWSSNADPFDGGTGDTRGGLAYNFKQYNATYNNSAVAQSTGNGLLYTLAPTLNSSLIGTATKTYDGLSSITTLTAGNYSAATGAVDGDTLSLTTPTTGTLDATNVGNNINVSVTRAKDSWTNGSAAVYGYQVAQSSGNIAAITTKALTISGPSIADKSYDGTPRAGALTKGALSGLVGNETLTVTASAANLSSETVGNYTTTVRYALANGTNGGLASNYSLADTAGVTARIIKLSKSDEAILISTSGVVSETYKSRTEVGVCMSDLSKDLEANAARTTTGDKDRLNYDLNPTLLNNKFNQRCQRNLSLIKIPENSLDNGFLNRELR